MKEKYYSAIMETDQGWKKGGISVDNVEHIIYGNVLPEEQLDMFFEKPLSSQKVLVTNILVPLVHVGKVAEN